MNWNCKAILFDAVGTLIYPKPDVITVYHHFGRKFGSTKSVSAVRNAFTKSYERTFGFHDSSDKLETNEVNEQVRWQQVVADVFDDLEQQAELFEELWIYFSQPGNWELFEDVVPVWTKLCSRNLTVGIASNFDARLHAICQRFPILADCEYVFISTEVGFSKPNPEFFKKVSETLGLHSSEIMIVGDSLIHDIKGGKACGWHTQWLQRSSDSSHDDAITSLHEML